MFYVPPVADHWIVRMNYRNRAVCFAFIFGIFAVHWRSTVAPENTLMWLWLGLTFLVYPHFGYWRARTAKNQREAEIGNMLIDGLLFGIWLAVTGFPVWISFILLIASMVNLSVFRGPVGFVQGLAAVLAGAVLALPVTGLRYAPETYMATTLLCMASITYYLFIVSVGAHTRATKLHEAWKQLRVSEQALQDQLGQIRALQHELKDQANRDPLTGLYNRRYMGSALAREIARCESEGLPLCLMLLDLDFFKEINDRYGHPAGDAVLVALAQQLTDQARASDVVCRYGGEEFLLVLPGMSLGVACSRATRLQQTLAEREINVGEAKILVTLSVGMAFYPTDAVTAEGLIKAADQALYEAKAQGRNRVVLAPASAAHLQKNGSSAD